MKAQKQTKAKPSAKAKATGKADGKTRRKAVRFSAGTPADWRVRNVVLLKTDYHETPFMDSGEINAAYIRAFLPCRVSVPVGLSRRFPDFAFDGNATVIIYGKGRKRKNRIA